MCHSDRVAPSHYLRDDLTAVGAEAINIIALCTNKQEPTSLGQEGEPSTSPQEGQQPHAPEKVQQAQRGKEKSFNRPLTTAEKATISEVFRKEIMEDTVVRSQDLRPKMMMVVSIRKLLPYKNMLKKVADYVRYLQQVEPRKDPQDLPEIHQETRTSAWVEQTSTTATLSTTRTEWLQEQSKLITKYFVQPDKALTKAEIMALFKEKEDLKQLLTTKTMQQCIDKIKNMRKKTKKSTSSRKRTVRAQSYPQYLQY